MGKVESFKKKYAKSVETANKISSELTEFILNSASDSDMILYWLELMPGFNEKQINDLMETYRKEKYLAIQAKKKLKNTLNMLSILR